MKLSKLISKLHEVHKETKVSQQRDSKAQPLSSYTSIQPFSQTGQMNELHCDYLSEKYIYYYLFSKIYTVKITKLKLHKLFICYFSQ